MDQAFKRSQKLHEALKKDFTAVEAQVREHDDLPHTTRILRLAPGHAFYEKWRDVFTRLRAHEQKLKDRECRPHP